MLVLCFVDDYSRAAKIGISWLIWRIKNLYNSCHSADKYASDAVSMRGDCSMPEIKMDN